MLGKASLKLLFLFGLLVLFLLFDLVACLGGLLVSLYVNLALWSQET